MSHKISLVVDDEPSVRNYIVAVLEGDGFQTIEAENGVHALELMHEFGGTVDLLVSDIKMPLMDGFALLERMRAEPSLQMIPVVLLTGNLDAARGAVGADGVLVKPFEPAELIAMIAKLTQQDAATATV